MLVRRWSRVAVTAQMARGNDQDGAPGGGGVQVGLLAIDTSKADCVRGGSP